MKTRSLIAFAVAVPLSFVSPISNATEAGPDEECEYYFGGEVTMWGDGTISIKFVDSGPGYFSSGDQDYAPDHDDYGEILEFIGGLTVGEKKTVFDFPWVVQNPCNSGPN